MLLFGYVKKPLKFFLASILLCTIVYAIRTQLHIMRSEERKKISKPPSQFGESNLHNKENGFGNFSRKNLHKHKGRNKTRTTPQPNCPVLAENNNTSFKGSLESEIIRLENSSFSESSVASNQVDLKPGGWWSPKHCTSRHKVAVIIPFRDRQSHLIRLIDFLIPILQRQNLDFRIIVSEQNGTKLFNKGRLMNAGFLFAQRMNVSCVIFHDVDMLPENDRIPYSCSPDSVLHLGAYTSSLNYTFLYDNLVGGVLAFRAEDFERVNGYSNRFWGWGGEDDDMGIRIKLAKVNLRRLDRSFCTYTMLKHQKRGDQEWTPEISKALKNTKHLWKSDGLRTQDWKIIDAKRKQLYYHLLVDVGDPPPEWIRTKTTMI